MSIQFYGYDRCDTCRKARKWLDAHNVSYTAHDITVDPPSRKTLKQIVDAGDYELKALFNRSGVLYREMSMKDKLATRKESELLDLLAGHGKLIKRPIVTDGTHHTVGFDPKRFDQTWK